METGQLGESVWLVRLGRSGGPFFFQFLYGNGDNACLTALEW
jgi:hypothetical protein